MVSDKIEQRKGVFGMPVFNLAYITERRKALGLSNQEIARQMGYKDPSTWWKYENGDYKINAEKLPLLAKILRCSIKKFYS
jgi:transcriptional regulator with XRE-family HTH domain